MTQANPLWGAPRIHGELLKLGIDISERTVSRLMPKKRKPPSQTWRTFLDNHFRELVSIDFLTVPTATFRVLYVLVVLAHDRRRIVHFNVTEHPTAAWTAQQIIEAFPEETAPRFLVPMSFITTMVVSPHPIKSGSKKTSDPVMSFRLQSCIVM
jgi:putative transposase